MMLGKLGPLGGRLLVLAVVTILTLLAVMTFRAHRRATAALANQVLEKADRAKSLLFAKPLSHEFRTPLNAVIGTGYHQRETLRPGRPSQKYAEYIGDIHTSVASSEPDRGCSGAVALKPRRASR